MNAASTFATKICQRSTERVRIVFSVPLPSSVATMSPATSAVISGKNQNAAKNSPTSGIASPVSRTRSENGIPSGPSSSASSAVMKISGTSRAQPSPM